MASVSMIPPETIERRKKEIVELLGSPNDYMKNLYAKYVLPKQGKDDILPKGFEINFYDLVQKLGSSHPYRLTRNEVAFLESVENGLACFLAFYDTVREQFQETSPIYEVHDRGDMFSKVYSLYAGCIVGLEGVDHKKESKETPSKKIDLDFRKNADELTKELMEIFVSDLVKAYVLGEKLSEDALVEKTGMFFASILNECLKEKENYEDLAKKVKEYSIKINNATVNGFDYYFGGEVDDFGDVTYDDVIGNEEFKKSLKSITDKLLLYDTNEQKNVIKEISDMPKAIFVYGPPGTGKTLTLRAGANYFLSKAKRLKKPADVSIIDSSILSKYVGESSKNLRELYEKGTDPNKIGLIYIEDIDAIFPPREELRENPVKKELIGTLLNLIQGVKTRERGNYVVIATTNKPKGTDDAQNQRLFQKIFEVKGPQSEEDIINLTKVHLRKGLKAGYIRVSDKQWEEIGRFGYSSGLVGEDIKNVSNLVGRDIENVSKDVNDYASSDLEIDDSVYFLPKDEQKKALLEKFKKVDGKHILQTMKKYSEEKKKHTEMERRDRVKRRVEDMLMQMDAELEVLKNEEVLKKLKEAEMGGEQKVKK